MKKYDTKIIIIDDDTQLEHSEPFVVEAQLIFDEVIIFNTANEGLNYIKEHLGDKLIVLLDLKFPNNEPNGEEVLREIREITMLIPVVIFTATNGIEINYQELINYKAFEYLKKSATSKDIIDALKRANDQIDNDVCSALETWIEANPEDARNEDYIATLSGRSLSLNDIVNELRHKTPLGLEFAKQLNELTIDLIMRNKESLDA